MVRNRFDSQLAELNTRMTAMGELCELAIRGAATALQTGDVDTAREVVRADAKIDQAERDIEHLCMKLLLQQQPVARDLRQISAALKMITDLERIGDQAADIAEIVISCDVTRIMDFPKIVKMAKKAGEMVTAATVAYANRDLELAQKVILQDEAIDRLFVKVRGKLINFIISSAQESAQDASILSVEESLDGILGDDLDDLDAASVDELSAYSDSFKQDAQAAIDAIMIAKYLERIADHATNVAEWVAFSITGVHVNDFDTKQE